jgi:hypothetical protein
MQSSLVELARAFQLGGHFQMPVNHRSKLSDLPRAASFDEWHPALLYVETHAFFRIARNVRRSIKTIV